MSGELVVLIIMIVLMVAVGAWMMYSEEQVSKADREKEEAWRSKMR